MPMWRSGEPKSAPEIHETDLRTCPAGVQLGENVEQRAEHAVRRSDHVRAGLGEEIRLAQIRQWIQEVLIVGIRYLLRILSEHLAAAGNRGAAAADCARQAGQWKYAAD
jgi:hypothetical protein